MKKLTKKELDQLLKIKTVKEYKTAPIWRRIIAFIVDILIIGLFVQIAFQNSFKKYASEFSNQSFMQLYSTLNQPEVISALRPLLIKMMIVMVVLSLIYWTLLEWKVGQSLGKMLMGIFVFANFVKRWHCNI